jgi:hypothetical protein
VSVSGWYARSGRSATDNRAHEHQNPRDLRGFRRFAIQEHEEAAVVAVRVTKASGKQVIPPHLAAVARGVAAACSRRSSRSAPPPRRTGVPANAAPPSRFSWYFTSIPTNPLPPVAVQDLHDHVERRTVREITLGARNACGVNHRGVAGTNQSRKAHVRSGRRQSAQIASAAVAAYRGRSAARAGPTTAGVISRLTPLTGRIGERRVCRQSNRATRPAR